MIRIQKTPAEKKIERIRGSVPLIKLSEHPVFQKDGFESWDILRFGYVATICLNDYESVVPDGKTVIDRHGYDYIGGLLTQPLYTLSEWRDAYPDAHKPCLMVNANWFNIWESTVPGEGRKINPREFSRTFLMGLALNRGNIVSKSTVLSQNGFTFDSILIDNKMGVASILANDEQINYLRQKQDLKSIDAVSGFLILKDGIKITPPMQDTHASEIFARTGIGISEERNILYVVVIQPGLKQHGITMQQFAVIFEKLGAKNAINLDGAGSSELLYIGENEFGQRIKVQTNTSDTLADGTPDSERPKPNFIGFYPKRKKCLMRDDSYTFFSTQRVSRDKNYYIKDDSELLKDKPAVQHDSYFNNRKKALYESKLAGLFIKHAALFATSTTQISQLILPDIIRITQDELTQTSAAMRYYFLHDYDLRVLFGQNIKSEPLFFERIISALQHEEVDSFYKHMCIHRAYITFFIEKGKANPTLDIARREEWIPYNVNLEWMLYDVSRLRGRLFDGLVRKLRPKKGTQPSIFELTSKDIGIIPSQDFSLLSIQEQEQLKAKLPIHKPGMQAYFITGKGPFTHKGMYHYDMPQLCGPSGMTAMRLALANQAGLSQDEKELYAFAVSMYHVAIGAHTVDECFCIGNRGEFNHYQRGNYDSILPEALKNDERFAPFYAEIEKLNHESNPEAEPIASCSNLTNTGYLLNY